MSDVSEKCLEILIETFPELFFSLGILLLGQAGNDMVLDVGRREQLPTQRTIDRVHLRGGKITEDRDFDESARKSE